MKLNQLVKVIDVEPLPASDDAEIFKFRIEVLRELHGKKQYYARVLRRETYRIRPTFPLRKGRQQAAWADHELLVVDDMIGADDFRASTVNGVLTKVRRRLRSVFGIRGRE